MEKKVQKQKVGVAGSFINQMMSNNATEPIVGHGATEMHYTDRTCYEVLSISNNGKTVLLEYLNAEADKRFLCDVGHQNWLLKPSGRFLLVTWRNNSWRTINVEIVFTPEYLKKCHSQGIYYIGLHLRKHQPELADKIYGTEGSPFPINVVDGITKEKKTYNKIKLIWGVKDYYYDWSF